MNSISPLILEKLENQGSVKPSSAAWLIEFSSLEDQLPRAVGLCGLPRKITQELQRISNNNRLIAPYEAVYGASIISTIEQDGKCTYF